ncbi:hypothetical protein [Burkholderia contaminans]|uniref:hypothetical protein n=1 Tax=Burkholderia contaminans TaxID=488447 RepID=UPI00158D8AD1|nr:hypothetical protein [Burkholderia contaminans]
MEYLHSVMENTDLFDFIEDEVTDAFVRQLVYLDGEQIGMLELVFATELDEGQVILSLIESQSEYQDILMNYGQNELTYLSYQRHQEEPEEVEA